MKVLNLYAGIGGNRALWTNCQVTAVEQNDSLCAAYASAFPDDEIVCGDAHSYLIKHYRGFDFIWSSPPCQSHGRFNIMPQNFGKRYPDLSLYEEIIFLKHFHLRRQRFVVENVIPYYDQLVRCDAVIGRHLIWSNFGIKRDIDLPKEPSMLYASIDEWKKYLGINVDVNVSLSGRGHKEQVYRNCVHPVLGKHIFDCAFSKIETINEGLFSSL